MTLTMVAAPSLKIENGYALAAKFQENTWIHLQNQVPKAYCQGSFERSVNKRKSEFLVGRYLAHMAVASLQPNLNKDLLILANKSRAPEWPDNILGSITHTNGFCHVVVKGKDPSLSLGIDSESLIDESKVSMFTEQILVPSEWDLYEKQYGHVFSPAEFVTFIFSAKESIYKAIYPFVEVIFGFEAAAILSVDLSTQSFIFKIKKNLNAIIKEGFLGTGRFVFEGSMVHTSVEIFSPQINDSSLYKNSLQDPKILRGKVHAPNI